MGVLGRQVHLCARCSGIYPGLLVGLFVPLGSPSIWVIALLPAPALLDWVVTTFRSYHDYNVVRTATGLLLGYGYGVGLIGVFVGRRPAILLVGLAYGGLAVALLALHRRSPT